MPGGSSTGTVLVADDEAMLLRLVDNVLTRAGFQVVRAVTGTEATTPAVVATTANSIFIASMTTSRSPSATRSPGSTLTVASATPF